MSFFTKTKLVCAAAVIAATTSFAFSAIAADDKPFAAVVDMQKIFEKSTAALKIREQLDKKAEEFKKDSAGKEDYFKKKYDELEKKKSVLSKEAFEKQNNDLSKEFGDAQKKVQDNREALDKAYMEAMQKFETELTEVVKQEATKVGSKVVLPKMHVIYSDPALEITDKVLEGINKKLPDVAVKF